MTGTDTESGMKTRSDERTVGQLERAEEDRKKGVEAKKDAMSTAEYRESLEKEYGDGKWAHKVIEELVNSRNQKTQLKEESQPGETDKE